MIVSSHPSKVVIEAIGEELSHRHEGRHERSRKADQRSGLVVHQDAKDVVQQECNGGWDPLVMVQCTPTCSLKTKHTE